jgi:hypothetical protein
LLCKPRGLSRSPVSPVFTMYFRRAGKNSRKCTLAPGLPRRLPSRALFHRDFHCPPPGFSPRSVRALAEECWLFEPHVPHSAGGLWRRGWCPANSSLHRLRHWLELFEDELLEPARGGLWDFGVEQKMPVHDLRTEHAAARLNQRKMPTIGERHAQFQLHQGIDWHG